MEDQKWVNSHKTVTSLKICITIIISTSFVTTQPRHLKTNNAYLVTCCFVIGQILADPTRSCRSISSISCPAGVTNPKMCHPYNKVTACLTVYLNHRISLTAEPNGSRLQFNIIDIWLVGLLYWLSSTRFNQ